MATMAQAIDRRRGHAEVSGDLANGEVACLGSGRAMPHGCSKILGKPCNGLGGLDRRGVRRLNSYADLRSLDTPWTILLLASGAKGHRFESCIARTEKGPESLGKIPGGSGPFAFPGAACKPVVSCRVGLAQLLSD